jgi:hypothetical protein
MKSTEREMVKDVETADGLGVVRIEREHGEERTVVLEANRAAYSKGDLMGLVRELDRVAETL